MIRAIAHRNYDDKKISGLGYWAMVVTFALFFSPKGYAVSAYVYYAWHIAIVIGSLAAFCLYLSRSKVSQRWILFMLFLASYYLLSTIVGASDGQPRKAVFNVVSVGGFVTLLEYGLQRDRESCLDAVLTAGLVMCGVHFATFLRYGRMPYGMKSTMYDTVGEMARHPWFFLTHDNGSVFYFLPVIGGLWYRVLERGKGLAPAIAFSAATLYMYWTLNTVTAKYITTLLLVCIVMLYFCGIVGPFRWLTYRRTLLIGFGFCMLVLLFYSNDFFVQIALRLGKTADLGRGRIWQRAWMEFWRTPIFGLGFEEDATSTIRLGINHCHNIVLQILYTGGMVSVCIFVAFLTGCNVPQRSRTRKPDSRQIALLVTMIAILMCATFDWYLYMPIQFLPFVLYHHSASGEHNDMLEDHGNGLPE